MIKAAQLFDAILGEKLFRNDAKLAEAMEMSPPNLSRLRHGHRPMTDALVLRIHDVTGWAIRDIKAVLEMPCRDQLPMTA